MKTLAVLLISLALAQAITRPYTNEALDLIGTDAINDAIKYYNRASLGVQPPTIPDVTAGHVDGADYYHARASDGSLLSNGEEPLELVSPANVEFQVVAGMGPGGYRRLVANFSITINGMELHYDNVKFEYKGGLPALRAANNITADAVIEKNKFLLQVEQRHYIVPGRSVIACDAVVRLLSIEEFVVGDVAISGSDPAMAGIIQALADKFKDQLLNVPYAASLVKSVIEQRAPSLFRYCQYVPYFPID